mgnify:CR=1 FL=1
MNIAGLTQEQIEAYELRAPWNPAPATFEAVTQRTRHLVKAKAPSEECVRKRFKKACLAIFKGSGVYFEETALGLEAYGIPKQTELKKLVKDFTSMALPTAIQTATNKATTSTTTARSRNHPRTSRTSSSHYEATIYAGELVAVQLQTEDYKQPVIRICNKRLIPNYNALIDYDVTVTAEDEIHFEPRAPTLPFSTEAFDHWHASICLDRRRTFPDRTYLCKEVADGQYMLRDNGVPRTDTTIGLMFETYCVSQAMGTTAASKMVLDEIVRKLSGVPVAALRLEDVVVLQYLKSGDPLLDAVNEFLRRTVGSGSEDDAQAKDEYFEAIVDVCNGISVCGEIISRFKCATATTEP